MIKKIVLDENLSPRMAQALRAFIALDEDFDDLVVEHLRDLGYGGEADDVWTKKLKPFRTTLIISSDAGKRKQPKGTPLPQMADQLRIPIVFLYGELGQRFMLERLRALLVMWPDIKEHLLRSRRRSMWRIKCLAHRGYRLEEWSRRKPKQRQFPFMFEGAETGDNRSGRG
ncbi:MAG: hypothetical protein IT434_12650 [Phycisphaerales bacterium]|nr:hypothetical protein [Phycisphaerales bacterium]